MKQLIRKPRFKRDPAGKEGVRLNERDINILKQVHKYRFLDSDLIAVLDGGSKQNLSRRLQKLFHAGYLDRPRGQRTRPDVINNMPFVYGVGQEGAHVLSEKLNIPLHKIDWSTKNREARGMFIDHTLMVARVLITIKLACDQREDVDFIDGEIIEKGRLKPAPGKAGALSWKVNVKLNGKDSTMNVVPDGAFGIQTKKNSGVEYKYFFLEVDRSTMPIVRSVQAKSSIHKKMVGYLATWNNNLFADNFGSKKVQIITTAKSSERIKSMFDLNKSLDPRKQGNRLFLFTLEKVFSLNEPEKALKEICLNGFGEKVSLI